MGKTSVINRYVKDEFQLRTEDTVVIDHRNAFEKLPETNQEVHFEIWDTVGQEIYRSLNKFYYRDCSACLLVFDLMRLETFTGLDAWLKEFVEQSSDPSRILFTVLGNKLDLVVKHFGANEEKINVYMEELAEKVEFWIA